MVYISGKYQHVKDERVVQFLKEIGISQELIEKATEPNFILEVSDQEKKQIFKSSTGFSMTYVLDEEFEEPMIKGAKSIAKRQDDVITVTSKTADGRSTTRVYDFTKDGLTVVLTIDNIIAKRHFKRI